MPSLPVSRESATSPFMGLAARPRASSSGLTLVEITVTITILMLGLLGISSTVASVHSLEQSNRERVRAENSLRSITAQIHSVSSGFLQDPETWAGNLTTRFAAGTPGSNFAVAGLDPILDADTTGTITVIVDETLTDEEIGARLGMPRDLDGDGVIASTNVSTTATLLPIFLQVQWNGSSGDRIATHGLLLTPH